MPKAKWDEIGERLYEAGVEKGLVFPYKNGAYASGAPWNGLIGVTETPSGAEPSPLYANNRKYLSLISAEDFGGSIEAYMYPDEFAECDGSAELAKGVHIKQQKRIPFGFSYVTFIGSDTDGTAHGYTIHLVYNATVSPSERSRSTINEDPDAMTLSWDFTTTPIEFPGFDPTAHIEIRSTDVTKQQLAALETMLYGEDGENGASPKLPMPSDLISIFSTDNA